MSTERLFVAMVAICAGMSCAWAQVPAPAGVAMPSAPPVAAATGRAAPSPAPDLSLPAAAENRETLSALGPALPVMPAQDAGTAQPSGDAAGQPDETWPVPVAGRAGDTEGPIGAGGEAEQPATEPPIVRGDDPLEASAPGQPVVEAAADVGAQAAGGAPVARETATKYPSVWEHLRAGFRLNDMNDALVKKWENFYIARPEYWQRINERGKRYLYYITAEIERRGMPLEIALLPIIESAYNPEALSRARASGLWQFVPATGKLYGLQQNWWLDNRRDVSAATNSALDYLQRLYEMFGDWQLALASYNWGEGAVQRAVNKNRARHKPTNYASLKMPAETRNYLPKLQAVKNLIAAPEKYGIALPEVADAPYFTTVTTTRQIDVALAARLADMPLEDFRILNPAHNRPVMAGLGEQRINLPREKAETFVINLDAYDLPLVSWRSYQLKQGEKLDQVAHRVGMEVGELKQVNGLSGNRRINPGFTLLVPAGKTEAPPEPIPTALFREAPRAGPAIHRVKRGESLAGIAGRYDLSVADLRKLNALQGDSVRPGMRLRLHDGVSAAAGSAKTGKRGSKKKTVTPKRRR